MVCGGSDRNDINSDWLQRIVYCKSYNNFNIHSIRWAGAILVMLGESMIPEVFKTQSFGKGLALLAGFVIAVILTRAQGG